MIKLRDLSKSFGSKWVLRGLSLEVSEGEIFGLVGPNGAGKTTAIRIMTGILMPTTGEVFIGGYNITTEPLMAKSIIGYVPDRPFFYEKLTGRELLIFLAGVHEMEKNNALLRIDELLELFGIRDIADELIEGYSSGMRQRLLFAGSMLHTPKVLIIDEPFIGIDYTGVILIKDILRDFSAYGNTLFLATHNLHIAEELCHRVGLIHKGRLLSIKEKQEILDFPEGLEGIFLKEIKEAQ